MERTFFGLGAVFGLLAVMLGAFAAHGLKGRLDPETLLVWETGARYQMYHALALLMTAWATTRFPGAAAVWAGWLFVAGIVLFSGSLYALALTGIRALGIVTPFGGLSLLAGWVLLAVAAWRGP